MLRDRDRSMGARFSGMLAPALGFVILVVGATVALAKTPDGLTPAEEDVCEGETGAAFGLCNAYCEAQDCDVLDPERKSCQKLRRNFERHTGTDIFPCDPLKCVELDPTVDQCVGGACDFKDEECTVIETGECEDSRLPCNPCQPGGCPDNSGELCNPCQPGGCPGNSGERCIIIAKCGCAQPCEAASPDMCVVGSCDLTNEECTVIETGECEDSLLPCNPCQPGGCDIGELCSIRRGCFCVQF